MTAAALHGANFGALAWTLLCLLAAIGAACLIVSAIIAAFCIVGGNRDRRAKRRRSDPRPGYLPEKVTRSYREPMRDEWGNPHSGVSDDELEALYAQPAREPRR
jgi:hypothetical protein